MEIAMAAHRGAEESPRNDDIPPEKRGAVPQLVPRYTVPSPWYIETPRGEFFGSIREDVTTAWIKLYGRLPLMWHKIPASVKVDDGQVIIRLANGVTLTEPMDAFPSDEMVAQLVLLLS